MTKEQQIEEMVKFAKENIEYNILDGNEEYATEVNIYYNGFAEALYNAGYRKVPQYAVILTPKQRDEEMKAYNEERAEIEKEIERLKEACQSAIRSYIRMETLYKLKCNELETTKQKAVKEFAWKIKDYIDSKVMEDFDDSDSVKYYTIDLDEFESKVDELLNEFLK